MKKRKMMTEKEIVEAIKDTYHYHPTVDMVNFMQGKRWAFNLVLGRKDWVMPEQEHIDREQRVVDENDEIYYQKLISKERKRNGTAR